MRRRKPTRRAPLPRRANRPADGRLPKKIASYIKGKVVDISTSHEYFAKHCENAIPRVQRQVKTKGRRRYQLSEGLFSLFSNLLAELVDRHYGRSEMNEGDFLARALYRSCWLYPRGGRRNRLTRHRELWPKTRPVSEAWKELGDLQPFDRQGILVAPETGGNIALNVYCSAEKTELPKIRVEIEGEPVSTLMKAMFELENLSERRQVKKRAKRIWEFIFKQLSVYVGIAHLKSGRPQEYILQRAAYLHDFEGLSWSEVARQLCQEEHRHNRGCAERFRKGATQYWKRCHREALTLA